MKHIVQVLINVSCLENNELQKEIKICAFGEIWQYDHSENALLWFIIYFIWKSLKQYLPDKYIDLNIKDKMSGIIAFFTSDNFQNFIII